MAHFAFPYHNFGAFHNIYIFQKVETRNFNFRIADHPHFTGMMD